MPQIYELFGYRVGDKSQEAESHKKRAWCPFMDTDCDGGGNRYLSHVHLGNKPRLKAYFGDKDKVPSGVCSLQPHPGDRPWIVCPRRLMVLRGAQKHQDATWHLLFKYSGYPSKTRVGIWPEVKIKCNLNRGGKAKSFDYTFDYILMPVGRVSKEDVEEKTGKSAQESRRMLETAGYSVSRQGKNGVIEDFPKGDPVVVEIMTSSTSGGNKDKRTTVPMAFEDAILGKKHEAPGINYRQVWARMVSQLVVKSEVAMAWGGKTFWILQDALTDYISDSTALDLAKFEAEKVSEVNILAFSYGDRSVERGTGVVELGLGKLYAGPIRPAGVSEQPCFQDMIRAPACPPKATLIALLAKRKPTHIFTIP